MPDSNMATYTAYAKSAKKVFSAEPECNWRPEGVRRRERVKQNGGEGGGFRCLGALRIQAKRSCRVLVMADGQGERERVIFLDSAPICPSLALSDRPRLSS